MGQVRGQATLDVDGEHPNNSRGWRGRRGLVDRGSRFGHFEGGVVVAGGVCCLLLWRLFPLACAPPRARRTSPPPAVSASEQLSGSESGGRLALVGLALPARSAMNSRPFEDGVTVLVERRGVLGWSTADCELVAGTGGTWVGGRVAET